MKLKSLLVTFGLNGWFAFQESLIAGGIGLTGDHPLSRWADGIEGLRNAGWRVDDSKNGCWFSVNYNNSWGKRFKSSSFGL